MSATVRFPAGYDIPELPEGWVAAGPRSATWSLPALEESSHVALSASSSQPNL